MPARASDPIIIHDDVNGRLLNRLPIFRISCSLPKLWIIAPEHMNNMALKKA